MIAFAIPKLLFMQFRILHHQAFKPLAEISKYEHMWSFFGRSHNYNIFLGTAELLIGVLIIFKRTRLIALLISAAVCVNILLLNVEFEVYFALSHVILDLILTLLLLIPYRKTLYSFFILHGGGINLQSVFTERSWLKNLRWIYIIIFPIGYFIYALNLKETVNDKIVGSYEIQNLKMNHENIILGKGSIGEMPMLFLEYNQQAVISYNDTLFSGSYANEKNELNLYFRTPSAEIQTLKASFSEKGKLKGIANDSIPTELSLRRLSEDEDYLNWLN